MKVPNIISIQKYSIHDGDGIRTTVFFKGCALNCWWCHNPESQSFKKEVMFNKEKCTNCLYCTKICSHNTKDEESGKVKYDRSNCEVCGKCLDYCVNNAREIVGSDYSINEIMKEIEKDSMFYESSFGGVTLSGGEVMLQDSDFIVFLLKKIKRKGYNVAIDTCGYAPEINYEKALPYVDTFLYDIKTMDNEKHKKYMGKGNELILSNLKYLSENNANIYIRIPIIGTVNDDNSDMEEIIKFLKENVCVKQVNLLPYHNIASSKYDRLDMKYKGEEFITPSKDRMKELQEIFIKNGFNNTKIGG